MQLSFEWNNGLCSARPDASTGFLVQEISGLTTREAGSAMDDSVTVARDALLPET